MAAGEALWNKRDVFHSPSEYGHNDSVVLDGSEVQGGDTSKALEGPQSHVRHLNRGGGGQEYSMRTYKTR